MRERKPFGPKEFEKFSFSIKLFWIKLSAFNGCIRKRIGRASRDLNALGSLLLTNSRTVWWARCVMSMRRSLSALWLSSNVALVDYGSPLRLSSTSTIADYGSRPPRWLASRVVSHWRKNNRRNRSKCCNGWKAKRARKQFRAGQAQFTACRLAKCEMSRFRRCCFCALASRSKWRIWMENRAKVAIGERYTPTERLPGNRRAGRESVFIEFFSPKDNCNNYSK